MSVTTVSSSMITDATILNADIGAAAAIATTKLGAGAVVQVVNFTTGAVVTGTTVTVGDDTIPQNTEGVEFMTLAITPTNASNKLIIDVHMVMAASSGIDFGCFLCQDTTANAIAATKQVAHAANCESQLQFTHFMAAGTTSETTFKVRAGGTGAATFTLNGNGGNRKYGGVMASTITITETSA